ncbi:hypothetical protein HNY73_020706 [Argiope bruennichi]|uniref:Uncharacterized protein n=1 Tax=Argiope bruennichi TaxID=94029 RepID=A0A8T0ECB9_ARGBR|nr:hypothetical protein HNY73_020706 [Argiope bruennichi]
MDCDRRLFAFWWGGEILDIGRGYVEYGYQPDVVMCRVKFGATVGMVYVCMEGNFGDSVGMGHVCVEGSFGDSVGMGHVCVEGSFGDSVGMGYACVEGNFGASVGMGYACVEGSFGDSVGMGHVMCGGKFWRFCRNGSCNVWREVLEILSEWVISFELPTRQLSHRQGSLGKQSQTLLLPIEMMEWTVKANECAKKQGSASPGPYAIKVLKQERVNTLTCRQILLSPDDGKKF